MTLKIYEDKKSLEAKIFISKLLKESLEFPSYGFILSYIDSYIKYNSKEALIYILVATKRLKAAEKI